MVAYLCKIKQFFKLNKNKIDSLKFKLFQTQFNPDMFPTTF